MTRLFATVLLVFGLTFAPAVLANDRPLDNPECEYNVTRSQVEAFHRKWSKQEYAPGTFYDIGEPRYFRLYEGVLDTQIVDALSEIFALQLKYQPLTGTIVEFNYYSIMDNVPRDQHEGFGVTVYESNNKCAEFMGTLTQQQYQYLNHLIGLGKAQPM